ncbi:MAG: hypothetical protein ACI8XU_001535 [Kiritimatiellia bacterium]|jgi:hypothetical protein
MFIKQVRIRIQLVVGLLLLVLSNSSYTQGNSLAVGIWPGDSLVTYSDDSSSKLDNDSSGITYEPSTVGEAGSLWLVSNSDSRLHQLKLSDTDKWVAQNRWDLTAKSGFSIDAEGVTKAEWESPVVYVASEREDDGPSKLGVIAFNTATSVHVAEWDLTFKPGANAVESPVGANRGWEGITWIPDSHLEGKFFDPNTAEPYDSKNYPAHGGGLFVLGLEATRSASGLRRKIEKNMYLFALHEGGGSFDKVASFHSGLKSVMGLEYDRDTKQLWVHCDSYCKNKSAVFQFGSPDGPTNIEEIEPIAEWSRPRGLKNSNFEGIAIFPESSCDEGKKRFIWTDDSGDAGEVLANNFMLCGRFPK